MSKIENQYTTIITPDRKLFELNIKDILRYKDLYSMFVRKDVVTVYKQTVLGPIWFFVQPIFTTLIYILVFNRIAKIPTSGIPPVLFYMSGIVIWNYFSESFNMTSKTFKENADLFGKVYFPRIIVPLSKITSGLIKFLIQLLLFFGFYVYFLVKGEVTLNLGPSILLVPFLLIIMAGLGMGAGLVFTSLTAKYRDLTFLLQFGVQLLMYATPVIYPLSSVPDSMRGYITNNPITGVVENFRSVFLGSDLQLNLLVYSSVFMILLLFFGLLVFNKTEKSFMDTV